MSRKRRMSFKKPDNHQMVKKPDGQCLFQVCILGQRWVMCRGRRSLQNQSFHWTPAPLFLANIFVHHFLFPASLEKTVKKYCWTQHRNKGLLSTHTHEGVGMILVFICFPLPPCPDALDLLVDFISSLANCIIGISIVFLMFPLLCAFGNLSIIPGLSKLPFSIAATALGFYKSSLQLPSSCTGQLRRCEQPLIPHFSLSWTVTALSQGSCFFCLFYLPVNSLFWFLHRNWGHGDDIFLLFRYH